MTTFCNWSFTGLLRSLSRTFAAGASCITLPIFQFSPFTYTWRIFGCFRVLGSDWAEDHQTTIGYTFGIVFCPISWKFSCTLYIHTCFWFVQECVRNVPVYPHLFPISTRMCEERSYLVSPCLLTGHDGWHVKKAAGLNVLERHMGIYRNSFSCLPPFSHFVGFLVCWGDCLSSLLCICVLYKCSRPVTYHSPVRPPIRCLKHSGWSFLLTLPLRQTCVFAPVSQLISSTRGWSLKSKIAFLFIP